MWHCFVLDTWRIILRGKKKELGYSNAKIAELSFLPEGAVARDLMDGSDPPLSRINAIATALGIPLEELFLPSLPNGMKVVQLVEEYAKIAEENQALRGANDKLRAKVDELRDKVDELNGEIIATQRRCIEALTK